MGWPGHFTVVRPSLETDGTVDVSGGTVADSVFGNRASVQFPAGILSAPTQVAIDVFSSPLDLPTPSGYSGSGTMFVNINLTPQPVFPLAFPGLTIVLPLTSPMPPGDRIDLYRVNPASGTLVPALDTLGQPVVGVVDPAGLSATFTGVARLSVVVGLTPVTLPVAIDIKPKSATNPIQPRSHGLTPVAILSSATFNAPLTIRDDSLTFGRTGNEPSLAFCSGGAQDVNGDGHFDLVCHFHTEKTGFETGDTQGILKGTTTENQKVSGADALRVLR
jgi:hypothetical protein